MPAQLVALTDGASILLDKPILLVGRHPESDIQINSRKISRLHCCIAQVSDYLVVRDLGSTNGIRINGVRVVEGRLQEGDELTIGHNRYTVQWDGLARKSGLGKAIVKEPARFRLCLGRSTTCWNRAKNQCRSPRRTRGRHPGEAFRACCTVRGATDRQRAALTHPAGRSQARSGERQSASATLADGLDGRREITCESRSPILTPNRGPAPFPRCGLLPARRTVFRGPESGFFGSARHGYARLP